MTHLAYLETSSSASGSFLLPIVALLVGIAVAVSIPVSMAVSVARVPAEQFAQIGTTKQVWTRRAVLGTIMPFVGLGYAIEWFGSARRRIAR